MFNLFKKPDPPLSIGDQLSNTFEIGCIIDALESEGYSNLDVCEILQSCLNMNNFNGEIIRCYDIVNTNGIVTVINILDLSD